MSTVEERVNAGQGPRFRPNRRLFAPDQYGSGVSPWGDRLWGAAALLVVALLVVELVR